MNKEKASDKEAAFYVTHFITEPPAEEGYVQLAFMTATPESLRKEKYFMGFGIHRSFDQNMLKAKVEAGSVVKLPVPQKITRDKGLWMDPLRNVYIGDKKDPFDDSRIFSVYNHRSAEIISAGIAERNHAAPRGSSYEPGVLKLYSDTFSLENSKLVDRLSVSSYSRTGSLATVTKTISKNPVKRQLSHARH